MDGITFSLLIVDDDEDDRFILDEAFKEIGYQQEVRKFMSGDYLFRYLEQVEPLLYPCLIVLDNTLPGMDATEIVRKLKGDPKYSGIPVVIHSTGISPDTKKTLAELGVQHFINKGSGMNEIVSIAKELRKLTEMEKRV